MCGLVPGMWEDAAWMGAQERGMCVLWRSFSKEGPVRWVSRIVVRGWWVGVWENLEGRGRVVGGADFWDHFVRVVRRGGRERDSWCCIWFQMVGEGVVGVAEKGGLLEFGGWREDRRVEMVFHKFRAADSAARIVSVSSVEFSGEALMELVETRAFWSLIRALRRESKVLR